MKIRTKLTVLFSVGMTTFLVLFCAVTLYYFHSNLLSEFDRTLEERFAYLERHLETSEEGQVYFRGSDSYETVKIKGVTDQVFVEVRSTDGKKIFSNTTFLLETPEDSVLSTIAVEDGRKLRMMRRTSGNYEIRAAFYLDRISDRMSELMRLFLILVPLGILAIAVMSYFFAKKALDPVSKISSQAQSISAESLDKRLPTIDSKDEIYELSETLNSLFARLEESFKVLKQFSSDASHELRTPLSAIRSTCQVRLQSDSSKEDYKRTIATVLEEIDRMTHLVDSLLMLSRGDAGAFKMNRTSVDLRKTANEVKGLLQVLAEEKGQKLDLRSELSEDTASLVNGDPNLIKQAFIGLLHNAIKYGPKDSNIQLEISSNEKSLQISVSDEGPGIDENERKKIFRRFYRIDSSRSRSQSKEEGGTGLGLAIVDWIGRVHGGSVGVRTNSRGGSTFDFSLPKSS